MAYPLVAKIVPFVRLPRGMDFFDYRVPKELENAMQKGSRVAVSFRGKKVEGIVWEIDSNQKEGLKTIEQLLPCPTLSDGQMRLCDWAAGFYACSRSLILPLAAGPRMKRVRATETKRRMVSQVSMIAGSTTVHRWTDEAWRDTHLLRMAKTHVNKKKQLMILCPTIARVHDVSSLLSKSYKKKLCEYTGALSKGAEATAREWLIDGSSLIAVGTRLLAFADMPNLETIIIDAAHRDEHCQYDMNPRYDARTVALWRAAHQGVLVDIMSPSPRIEDMIGGSYQEHTGTVPKQMRVGLSAAWRTGRKGFISHQLEEKTRAALENGKDVFYLVGKKGYASGMFCRDCEWVFTCSSCAAILPGARTPSTVCRQCAQTIPIPARCPSCKGVRFLFPGIGIEKISEEARLLFPDAPVLEFSSDTIHAEPVKSYCVSKKSSGTIVIGTTLVPQEYGSLFSRFGTVGVIAADAVGTNLNFRGQEEQWRTLSTTALLAAHYGAELVLQCFSPDSPFLSDFIKDDFSSFVSRTLLERNKFGWPPYRRCIVVYPRGKQRLEHAIDRLRVLRDTATTFSILSRGRRDERLLIRFNSFSPCALPPGAPVIINALPREWLVDTDPLAL